MDHTLDSRSPARLRRELLRAELATVAAECEVTALRARVADLEARALALAVSHDHAFIDATVRAEHIRLLALSKEQEDRLARQELLIRQLWSKRTATHVQR